MASFAADRDEEAGSAPLRSFAPPPQGSLLDRDVVSLCSRQRHLLEFAFRLADHGHTHVGNALALSRYTLLDLADGQAELVDGLERLLGHLGFELDQPVPGWSSPSPDVIDVQLD
ncbi:hypothetical protein [Maricaulis maris]|uniref:hypothetical protein n=1 Tax=Maricaulis maris TaxID=74318 RepID=UPI003B8DF499